MTCKFTKISRYSDIASLGQFKRFDKDEDEDFESYVERFEHYVRAVEVTDDLKVWTFVTAKGQEGLSYVKEPAHPGKA